MRTSPLPLTTNRQHRWQRRPMLLAMTAALLGAAIAWPQLADAAESSTVVEAVQLPAYVERQGQRRAAAPGAVLRAGDKALTEAGSRMLLRLADRSTIKLGEATEFVVETLTREPVERGGASKLSAGLRLVTGVFRYATDDGSKVLGNKTELNLRMATATVGIRGTDFWTMSDAEHDAACVFEGHVAVIREGKEEIQLTQPGAFWVTFTGQPERPAGQATPDQLAKFIDQADMQPGRGVLLQGGPWRLVIAQQLSGPAAAALRQRLNDQGYPAQVIRQDGGFEVRLSQLATERDAQAVQTRLQALGVSDARVVLAGR